MLMLKVRYCDEYDDGDYDDAVDDCDTKEDADYDVGDDENGVVVGW